VPKTVSKIRKREKVSPLQDNTLYRLQIIEEDEENNRVKVAYVGYGDEFDEWRRMEDVVTIQESEEDIGDLVPSQLLKMSKSKPEKFCLFEELASKIKSQLFSSRKGNPLCNIVVTFDSVHFDSLAVRGTKREVKGNREVYSLPSLTKLDDLLGDRWYIRGINSAGDFCYVEPGTVRFYLKKVKPRPDFQMRDDGTLVQYGFGATSHLVFQFVRSDGMLRQWSNVLQSCV